MALRELPSALYRLAIRDTRPLLPSTVCNGRRQAFSDAAAVRDIDDLESKSSISLGGPSEEIIREYDPVKRAQARRIELPPSRYGTMTFPQVVRN
jgi:large subunit ribosomal protein L5